MGALWRLLRMTESEEREDPTDSSRVVVWGLRSDREEAESGLARES